MPITIYIAVVMVISLKSYIPTLARVLNDSESALYERQRALVREGLLEATPGKGPGSGVRATPESVAMLLIGYLASVSLVEAGERARAIARAKAGVGKTAEAFKDALARTLSSEELAATVKTIRVGITHGDASIETQVGNTTFAGRTVGNPAVRIEVAMDADTVRTISKAVAALKGDAK
ncbi:hypothetical protein [Bradyrhizobium sp. OK095]|uniref:hypothetical protein n=1 Tax=Bradyrhizobium sp. OK095 TaxID=1882760 RepID=UPI000B81F505|nr:hypothetical protein [Bradyrhizobium sp. OK095]